MRRSRLLLLLLGVGLPVLLALCVVLSLFPRSPVGPGILPLTPEAATRYNSPCGRLNPAQRFRVLDALPTPRGKLVTYHVRCLARNYLGYAYLEKEEDGIYWADLGGGGNRGGPAPPKEELVDVGFGNSENEALVFGYSLTPQVDAVEAVCEDGRTIPEGLDDGDFTLRVPRADHPCQVRVLGADGRELRVISLPDIWEDGLP